MHNTAVILLCILTAYFVWRDSGVAFIAWYSGVEPSLSASGRLWIGIRGAIGVAAAITAIATL